MEKIYIAKEDMKLKVLEKQKKFSKGKSYKWDVFTKVYRDKFVTDEDLLTPFDIVIDCGNSFLDPETLELNLNIITEV